MDLAQFFGWLCLGIVGGTFVLAITGLICLSLPNSKLRTFTLRVLSGLTSAGLVLLTLSPIDVIPDVVPVVGWVDDVGYLVGALAAANYALRGPKRKHAEPDEDECDEQDEERVHVQRTTRGRLPARRRILDERDE